METTLAILMVLGIYIGVPVVVGLAIVGVLSVWGGARVRRAGRVLVEQAAGVHGEAVEEQTTKEHVTIA